MVWAAKVALRDAQEVKKYLLEKSLMDLSRKSVREGDFLYFALPEKISSVSDSVSFEVVEKELPLKEKKKTIESLLSSVLSADELKLVPRSQEVVGDILILEIPEELMGFEKEIAEAYLELHKNVKVVVKKTEIHSGVFRTRGVEVIAGENRKETVHLESGVRIKLNLEESYFSARLGHERLRIAEQVADGERVLAMFSGSGPYPLVLARHSQASFILGVEINPKAHAFALENLELNKVNYYWERDDENNKKKRRALPAGKERVRLINGDVREVLPKLVSEGIEKFDRVLMPLPKTSEEFLDVALPMVKVGGVINLYAFLNEKDIAAEGERVVKICKELGYVVEIERAVKCGQHAPYVYRVCYDIKVVSA